MNPLYIVLQRTEFTTTKGPACFLTLANLEEQFELALWDTNPDMPPRIGDLVAFREGGIRERDGKKSASRIDITVQGQAPEGHYLYELLPRPITREEWDETIDACLEAMSDEKMKKILTDHGKALYDRYVKYPAATSMHHAFPGGLLNHTHQMLRMFLGLYPVLPYPADIKPDRLILAILFHDYGKMCEYDHDGRVQEDIALLGHIYIGADKLQNIMLKEQIGWDEVKRTIHIILAHHGMLEYGSPVLPATAEAVVITYLDNLSAKTDAIHRSAHMDRSRCLGTNIIK